MSDDKALSHVEIVKQASRGLRGTLKDSLNNEITGALATDDQTLIKFHGIYQQDDRDRREERAEKKLEPAYSFMVRMRMPGGDCSAEQWTGIQQIADTKGSGVVKITTRQTIQIHGVVKSKLKPSLADFAELGLDSIAACGDVNRNVVAGSHPAIKPWHDQVHAFAKKISEHLLPKTRGFYEIFLDGEQLTTPEPEPDPLYQDRYLPRKFKIGLAIPPHNEIDAYAQDIGLIAIEEHGHLVGFNVAAGGGMGATHGNPSTYPRLATVLGFVTPDKVLDVCWQIVAVQRDFGNRSDRKRARLKYTIDTMGVEAFRAEVEKRLGYKFETERNAEFDSRGDYFGWRKDHRDAWHYTAFVENGVVKDSPDYRIRSFLADYAQRELGPMRFTTNQNIMLLNLGEDRKAEVDALLEMHGIRHGMERLTPLRGDAMACVALPTCPLALAEAQRYLPELITKVEHLLDKHHLRSAPISIRMTGCPNGCARPYVSEIGLIGTGPNRYNLQLGGDNLGTVMNRLYRENIDEQQILAELDQAFGRYTAERTEGESFGSFANRTLIAAIESQATAGSSQANA
jgi:sulfite reductase (NADPH) hemoprotein beta-component